MQLSNEVAPNTVWGSSRWNTNIGRDSRDGLKLCPPDAVDPIQRVNFSKQAKGPAPTTIVNMPVSRFLALIALNICLMSVFFKRCRDIG